MIGSLKRLNRKLIEHNLFEFTLFFIISIESDPFDYLFNANNMRVKKATPEGTVLYGWDNDRIFAEYDDQGNVIQETVYFGSMPVALLKYGNTYRIFADQINTPRVITDSANTVIWAWDSKPFGESVPNEDVDGDGTNLSYNLRFPGQYYDVETKKHYNFNRDYNPVTGRYVQSDPIGLDGGVNTFGYVGANPLTNYDPNGLYCFPCAAIIVAEVATAAANLARLIQTGIKIIAGVITASVLTSDDYDHQHRGTIQLQDNSGLGITRSWAKSTPLTQVEGNIMLTEIWVGAGILNKNVKQRLLNCGAFNRATTHINSGTKSAGGSKSFACFPQLNGERIDVQIFKGVAF